MTKTTDIYTAGELKKLREKLLKEQDNKDALTGLPLDFSKSVTDHQHDSNCFVRGIIHRSINSCLGRLENSYVRDLSWWYPLALPDFLRQAADYLELTKDNTKYRHPSFLKQLKIQFNKLNASQQNKVLVILGSTEGSNPAKRKDLFSKVILDRSLGFVYIRDVINQVKESNNERTK